jgi:catechol-2,3-dioxygenase
MISPNGIAHIQLTVRDVAVSRPFYYKLLHETFGMAIQYDVPGQIFYCIGARTGVLIRNAADEHKDTPFDQWRVGLHHFCFRLRSREDAQRTGIYHSAESVHSELQRRLDARRKSVLG